MAIALWSPLLEKENCGCNFQFKEGEISILYSLLKLLVFYLQICKIKTKKPKKLIPTTNVD